jgi:hypothetical protein
MCESILCACICMYIYKHIYTCIHIHIAHVHMHVITCSKTREDYAHKNIHVLTQTTAAKHVAAAEQVILWMRFEAIQNRAHVLDTKVMVAKHVGSCRTG